MATSAATCVGLVKTYRTEAGEVPALRGIDAEFEAGTLNAVVGISGSGKSTLLRLLAGLDRPTGGTVVVGRADVAELPVKALRALRRDSVAYVFQRPSDNFLPHLTVAEHLRLVGEGDRELEAEALAVLGLTDRRDHRSSELSGGEQQRAAFAQALVAGARIVLADEPTAELDTHSAAALLGSIGTLTDRGVTVIIATHDRTVTAAAHTTLELEHGRVRGFQHPLMRDELPPRSYVPGPVVAELVDGRKTFHRGDETVVAVDGVSIVVREGEMAALVGSSGSGKTTVLNLLAGWEKPDAGTVTVPGTDWDELAVVPQRFGLLSELTVRENVEYPARLAGRLDAVRPWLDELMETLALAELGARFPNETSIGQQQRTALARALALHPRVLLADEPTGHQDAASALAVARALRAAAEGGTACLVATHDRELADLFDTVYPLAGGRVV